MAGLALYHTLELLLFAFHALLVLFNVTGWAWRRVRRLHLLVISATVASWFGLGLACGRGYCPLTDWQWRIKRAIGETELPSSWLKYYLDRVTGASWDPALVDTLVVTLALIALALSVWLNFLGPARRGATKRSD